MVSELIHEDRVAGAQMVLRSLIVPALNAQARNTGVDIQTGITLAIENNLTWRDVVSDPRFKQVMEGPLGMVARTLADSFSGLAALKPGETIEGSTKWLFEQAAGMTFESAGETIPGWKIYGPVANAGAPGWAWATRLIGSMNAWFQAGMP